MTRGTPHAITWYNLRKDRRVMSSYAPRPGELYPEKENIPTQDYIDFDDDDDDDSSSSSSSSVRPFVGAHMGVVCCAPPPPYSASLIIYRGHVCIKTTNRMQILTLRTSHGSKRKGRETERLTRAFSERKKKRGSVTAF